MLKCLNMLFSFLVSIYCAKLLASPLYFKIIQEQINERKLHEIFNCSKDIEQSVVCYSHRLPRSRLELCPLSLVNKSTRTLSQLAGCTDMLYLVVIGHGVQLWITPSTRSPPSHHYECSWANPTLLNRCVYCETNKKLVGSCFSKLVSFQILIISILFIVGPKKVEEPLSYFQARGF